MEHVLLGQLGEMAGLFFEGNAIIVDCLGEVVADLLSRLRSRIMEGVTSSCCWEYLFD